MKNSVDPDHMLLSVAPDLVYTVLNELGFNDTSTLVGYFVSSPRQREKRDRRDSRGDEREGQGRRRKMNESEETEKVKTFPLNPPPGARVAGLAQL